MNMEFWEPVFLVFGTLALLIGVNFFIEKMKTNTIKATVTCCKIYVPMNGFSDMPYPKNTIKFLLDNNKTLTFKADMKTMTKIEELKNTSGTLTYKGSLFIEFKCGDLSIAAGNDVF